MRFEPKQFGRFFLLEKLAVGGMAEIYKAKTYGAEGFEKLLAIKRILPHCSADKEFITMLIDEAKLSVLLSHANIVQVYDLGKVGEDYFISMEYINGVNLRDILYRCREQERLLPPELAVFICSEVCKGLDYAHRKTDHNGKPLGIVHRDISPQNILISFEGEVKIVDFGIAKAAMNISHTMAGILKGKIAYMSPEQALGKAIDYRTDLFSIGIILFECLTGKKLFTGESQFEVLKKIRTTKVSLENLPTDLPLPLRKILMTALGYYPKDRYPNAGDMQSELTRFLYSTFVDFTPQRLAALSRELFSDELVRQQQQAIAKFQREQQTGSVHAADIEQEDIVQRPEIADTSPPTDPSHPTAPQESAPGAIPLPPERAWDTHDAVPHRVRNRLYGVVGSLLLLAGAGLSYWQWIHPRFFPDTTPTEFATVQITSQPAEADIQLDGKITNKKTPATFDHLTLDHAHTITLAKTGYLNFEQHVTPTSTTPIHVEVTLRAAKGTLIITSTPPGAAIRLNGQLLPQQTPATLTDIAIDTPLHIVLHKDQYRDRDETITLADLNPKAIETTLEPIPGAVPANELPAPIGKSVPTTPRVMSAPTSTEPIPETPPAPIATPTPPPQKITPVAPHKTATPVEPHVTKKEKPATEERPKTPKAYIQHGTPPETESGEGTVIITSRPRGATVILNGQTLGRTPLTVRGVKSGHAHALQLEMKGYATWHQSVQVEAGKERAVSAPLQKND